MFSKADRQILFGYYFNAFNYGTISDHLLPIIVRSSLLQVKEDKSSLPYKKVFSLYTVKHVMPIAFAPDKEFQKREIYYNKNH